MTPPLITMCPRKYHCSVISLVIIGIIYHSQIVFAFHFPCHFRDTVNVSSSATLLSNGSYTHAGQLLLNHTIATYSHIVKYKDEQVDVGIHQRACVCGKADRKACINLCCPWGERYNVNIGSCQPTPPEVAWPPQRLNVTFAGGIVREVDIYEQFVVQHYRPCRYMKLYSPLQNYYDEWHLLEIGKIYLPLPNLRIKRSQYCFGPYAEPSDPDHFTLSAIICDIMPGLTITRNWNAYCMLISSAFMFLTVAVYLWLPELRNHLGKAFICYLSGLIVGYILLAWHNIDALNHLSLSCKVLGYIAYFFFMAAFFWLNAISFFLWRSFKNPREMSATRSQSGDWVFLYYSLYAWGLALILLLCTWYAQEWSSLSDSLKPGIGGGHYCWLDVRTWSAMLYFYGPLLLLIAFNVLYFSLIALRIRQVQRELAHFTAQQESVTSQLNKQRDNFIIFLRLFTIMGITWSLEILSYFIGWLRDWMQVFYILDFCVTLQGVLIFVLFVLKPQVRKAIKRRLCQMKSASNANSLSTSLSAVVPPASKNDDQAAKIVKSSAPPLDYSRNSDTQQTKL